jgi:prepilin-type N-terminal cleavage/methylation domain-containing protein
MLHRIKIINRWESGFTLIEVLIALIISGLIGSGIAATTYQVININNMSSNRLIAVKQVEHVVDSISRDASSAQDVITSFGWSGGIGFVQFNWVTWDNITKQVKYTLPFNQNSQNKNWNNQLKRIDNTVPATSIVMTNYLDYNWDNPGNSPTNCEYNPTTGVLTVTISCTAGGATETRTFQVVPRAK